MQQGLPVFRDFAVWAWNRLVLWVRVWAGQSRSFDIVLRYIVEKPVFPRFETRDDRMPGRGMVVRGVLAGGVVAAADMTALRAPA